jgi:hypothetical protein
MKFLVLLVSVLLAGCAGVPRPHDDKCRDLDHDPKQASAAADEVIRAAQANPIAESATAAALAAADVADVAAKIQGQCPCSATQVRCPKS